MWLSTSINVQVKQLDFMVNTTNNLNALSEPLFECNSMMKITGKRVVLVSMYLSIENST